MSKVMYNIPNMLCYFRILCIPLMTVLFFYDNATTAWLNVAVFSLAGLSDWLDGRIARSTGQISMLGKFLDSSTDKMLIGAGLILLVGFDRLEGLWMVAAMVIFLREILIAGIREFMAMYNVIVPISKMGKWKLTVQMVAMGFLIAGEYGEMLIPHAYIIGKILFLLATVLTVLSGWDYLKSGIRTMQELDTAQNTTSS